MLASGPSTADRPLADADRLLAAFLPRAFRRPVDDAVRKAYVAKVEERLKAGDCFETAMRWAYRAALCSPDFLYHDRAARQARRLCPGRAASLISSGTRLPDDELTALAAAGKLRDKGVLRQTGRTPAQDPRRPNDSSKTSSGNGSSFARSPPNDPDRKLYPEFSPYLQDSMVAETRAYFRELIEQNLAPATW